MGADDQIDKRRVSRTEREVFGVEHRHAEQLSNCQWYEEPPHPRPIPSKITSLVGDQKWANAGGEAEPIEWEERHRRFNIDLGWQQYCRQDERVRDSRGQQEYELDAVLDAGSSPIVAADGLESQQRQNSDGHEQSKGPRNVCLVETSE